MLRFRPLGLCQAQPGLVLGSVPIGARGAYLGRGADARPGRSTDARPTCAGGARPDRGRLTHPGHAGLAWEPSPGTRAPPIPLAPPSDAPPPSSCMAASLRDPFLKNSIDPLSVFRMLVY
jgi:hypothetical protein